MAEYIDREAAIESSKHAWAKNLEPSQYIEIIPPADVSEVRHGNWIDRVDTDTPMHECSVCGARVVKGLYEYENPYHYCYHCGARMDEEKRMEEMEKGISLFRAIADLEV